MIMNIWHDIDETRITKEDFMCYIEIQKGSKSKYELDKETGVLRLPQVTALSRARSRTTTIRWTCSFCAANPFFPRRSCAVIPSASST